MFALLVFAAEDSYAPLPEKLIAAQTAFLENGTGEQKFADNVFKQLQQWARWRIVASRTEADIVISLDHKSRLHNDFFLRIVDRESGEPLWTGKRDVAIGSYGGVAKALVSDLRKRLPARLDGK